MDTIASRIKQARTQRGISQAQAATEAGVPRQRWWEWESGRVEPGLDSAAKIAKVLGITLDWLASGDKGKR